MCYGINIKKIKDSKEQFKKFFRKHKTAEQTDAQHKKMRFVQTRKHGTQIRQGNMAHRLDRETWHTD